MSRPEQNGVILPGHIVLGTGEGHNGFKGVIELSFGMDLSAERVNLFWTGTAYSFLGEHTLHGKENAEHYRDHFAEGHPEMEFTVWDVDDPDLPVTLRWDVFPWDKPAASFNKRNLIFEIPD